jgi:xylulokinase
MHGLVPLDRRGNPVRPAIIWMDRRTVDEVDWINRSIGERRLGAITLNRPATGFYLPSLLWLNRHEPACYHRIHKAVFPKDYVRFRITGSLGTDDSDASASLAFDTAGRVWAASILEACGLKSALCPESGSSMRVVGTVARDAAAALGVNADAPVVCGGGDQPCQAFAAGAVHAGDISISVGTGAQVSAPSLLPLCDPQLRTHTFCHVLPDTWYLMGATLNGGVALRWLADNVLKSVSLQELDLMAQKVPPGARGLVFVPYLLGERTPHFSSSATATLAGLRLDHGRSEIARAVMEGVAFALRDSLDLLTGLGIEARTAFLSGGAARSGVWSRIIADVMGLPVRPLRETDMSAVGAALMAGMATGTYASAADALQATRGSPVETIEPGVRDTELYAETIAVYRELYARVSAKSDGVS